MSEMLKAKLQEVYAQLQREHEILSRAYDAMEEDKKDLRAKLVGEKALTQLQITRYSKLYEENMALEESGLENEKLKEQVSKLLKKTRQDDIAYKDLASTFQTFIQRTQSTQTQEFIWGMRDPTEDRVEE